MTRDNDAMKWKEKLASLNPPDAKTEQSPARARIHISFDEIAAARDRGVTWQQVADLFTDEGITGIDGEPLTADAVRSLFHLERYARGERRKRRSRKTTPQPQQTAQPRPATEPTFVADENQGDHDDHQRGKFRVIPARPRGAPPRKQET